MRINFRWHKYRYFPYEKRLAFKELKSLFGQEPVTVDDGLLIITEDPCWIDKAKITTYFEFVENEYGERFIPLQSILESTTNGNKEKHEKDNKTSPLITRQSTRYSAHGLHEYRGKFNPQIVRTIGNVLGLKSGMWVLDPFCGSGTTLVESFHMGWNSIGVDINPLGVMIANAKIASLSMPIDELKEAVEQLKSELRILSVGLLENLQYIPQKLAEQHPSFSYLKNWFTDEALYQLAEILELISSTLSEKGQLIFKVILSDIVREVSLQDPSDLRIRRRKIKPQNLNVYQLYIDSLEKKIKPIINARYYLGNNDALQMAIKSDIRNFTFPEDKSIFSSNLLFDAVLTSPPYATGLPYVDTDRLSLVLFNLIPSDEIHSLQRTLIGNREITNKERIELEDKILSNNDDLPKGCIEFCRKLLSAVNVYKDGFRKQNVPALIYKYLADSSIAFRRINEVLKNGAPFALVIGRNQTVLGGNRIIIDTPQLLRDIAIGNNFVEQETMELNTYPRYDIHQANSISSETLIILRKNTDAH